VVNSIGKGERLRDVARCHEEDKEVKDCFFHFLFDLVMAGKV